MHTYAAIRCHINSPKCRKHIDSSLTTQPLHKYQGGRAARYMNVHGHQLGTHNKLHSLTLRPPPGLGREVQWKI